MEAGELPHLAAIRQRGVATPLATMRPTLSPLIWTTIATGVTPQRHGVLGFTAFRIRGVQPTFTRLAPFSGAGRLLYALMRVGLAETIPVGDDLCRAMRFWEVASAIDLEVAVVNWWATWPAEQVKGTIVSDRFFYFRDAKRGRGERLPAPRLVSPPELQETFSSLITRPDQLAPDQIRRFLDIDDSEIARLGQGSYQHHLIQSEFRFLHAMDETCRRIGLELLARPAPPDLTIVYFRGLDILSHAALRFSDLLDGAGGSTDEQQKYGQAVHRYYRYCDDVIGQLEQAAGPDATLIVVSDHGFEKEDDGTFNHSNGPPGVLFAAGTDIRFGGGETKASVLDIAPTLLYLMGAPVAEDLDGRVLWEILTPDRSSAAARPRVTTYGPRRQVETEGHASGGNQEYLERLRALGYIQ